MPRKLPLAALLVLGLALCSGLSAASTALPSLRVSENKRFIVKSDGQPFFWLGDTAWELFHRLNREDADAYLKIRAAQGFNVVQAVVLAELDGLDVPNPYGHLPLRNNDPLQPVEEYFQHVDWIVDRAAEHGIYIAMLPTWGDKWNKKWGKGPEIFTPENARAYGEWIGRRYAKKSVIWVLGGDRPVETPAHREITAAMAEGLRAGGGAEHLITFHPSGGSGSADAFHAEAWLDVNMRQNGHVAEYTERYFKTRTDYERSPVKPVVDGEPLYEDHPLSFKAATLGHSTATDVRRALYWDVFGGAFGHTYGHHSVWQMWTPERKPINAPLLSWREALEQPGAKQMQFARWLIESRPYLTRIPADDVIVPSSVKTAVPGEGRYRFIATRSSDGSYAMVYVPIARPFSVNLGVITGGKVKAWWFNPRDGKASAAGEFDAKGAQLFKAPNANDDLDWVLVLDDATKKFPAPGTRK